MDVREKLVDLIGLTEYGNGSLVGNNFQKGFIEKIASNLIANSVTVQEWIPVTEYLPGPGAVLTTDGKRVYLTNGAWMYKTAAGNIRIPANYGNGADVTHWMPAPKPPKEEKADG